VRVLVATTANVGHLGPVAPFAKACVAAGHEVRVAAPASFAAAVEGVGLRHVPVGDPPEAELSAVFETLPRLTLEEANTVVMRDVFAGIDARAALPGMAAAVREWRPDLVLRETAEFASYVVAEQYDIPHVHVAIALEGLAAFAYPLLDGALDRLGSRLGVAGLRRAPTLSFVPPTLEDPGSTGGHVDHVVHRFSQELRPADGPVLPGDWGDADRPLVYATLGTVAAGVGLFPTLYRAVVDAVADLPVRVLLTIGEGADPDQLRPLPTNVHVEGFWPQDAVMSEAAGMIGHGGFGTTMSGLKAGVPMVVVPLFALDQHLNARAVDRVSAGVALDGGPEAVDGLQAALVRILDDPSYRAGAQSVAAEMASLPAPSASVPLLEDLARI
jgi:UDP:flavonoid glycosyltransferase YjiC (YdhE family)